MKAIAGYDTSDGLHALSVLCADCGSNGDGSPIYEGDEWGGEAPCCEVCGSELPVTLTEGLY